MSEWPVETEAHALMMRIRLWTTQEEAFWILHDLLVELRAKRDGEVLA